MFFNPNFLTQICAVLAIIGGQINAAEENQRYSEYGNSARAWIAVSNLLDAPITGITSLRESSGTSWDTKTRQASMLLAEQLIRIRDNMRNLASNEHLYSLITDPELQTLGRREMLSQCTSMLKDIKDVCGLCDKIVELTPELKLQTSSSRQQLDKLLKYTILRGDEFMETKPSTEGALSKDQVK